MNTKRVVRSLAVMAVVLLLFAPSSPAKSKAKEKDLIGTWYVHVPGGLTALYTFHRHGTMSGAVSTAFGGPPHPPGPVTTNSMDNGLWAKAGRRFEAVTYRYNYDIATGYALRITRIRTVFSIDKGGESATGDFFVTQWSCGAMGIDCPYPNNTAPDPPGEFAPPGNTFTMTKVKLP